MANHGEFRYAPPGWTAEEARALAERENLALGEDHWELIRGLQEFFARNAEGEIRIRDLQDALEEKFHYKGGMKYLYTLFPGGPIVQGCRLAGLKPPAGSTDLGFGSVT